MTPPEGTKAAREAWEARLADFELENYSPHLPAAWLRDAGVAYIAALRARCERAEGVVRDVQRVVQSQFNTPHDRMHLSYKGKTYRGFGASSDALVAAAITGHAPIDRPHDPSDLMACEIAYSSLGTLQSNVAQIMDDWRLRMRAEWPKADWDEYDSVVRALDAHSEGGQ